MAHTPPRITLGRPINGWTTLTVNEHDIYAVSYTTPYLIEDLIDLLHAESDKRDLTIRIDREGRGMAYLTSTQMRELLVVTDDGDVHLTDQFMNHDEIHACANALADSIEQNLDGWALWQCLEEDEESVSQARDNVRDNIHHLRQLGEHTNK